MRDRNFTTVAERHLIRGKMCSVFKSTFFDKKKKGILMFNRNKSTLIKKKQ